MLSLEFVSLLLSKETPVQAGITLSKQLRDMVGIGTLGATLLSTPDVTDDKVRESHEIAAGWTIIDINKIRDASAKAHATLEKEIALEATYWDDIIDVTESGWSVSRMPQARHRLGVRFGSLEGMILGQLSL